MSSINPTVALLTDFGNRDWYVAAMKGVIKSVSSTIHIIDISHTIDPHDIYAAAFNLMNCYQHFPRNTVFCCVVDPGVGSDRKPLAAFDGKYFFVGPDNGIFSLVKKNAEKRFQCIQIDPAKARYGTPSETFHGRDIFAPVAARLSLNPVLESYGNHIEQIESLPLKQPQKDEDGSITGMIIYVDRFGNLITNLTREYLETEGFFEHPSTAELVISDIPVTGIRKTFSDQYRGEPLIYIGSANLLEIAINQGNAADYFHVSSGNFFNLKLE